MNPPHSKQTDTHHKSLPLQFDYVGNAEGFSDVNDYVEGKKVRFLVATRKRSPSFSFFFSKSQQVYVIVSYYERS